VNCGHGLCLLDNPLSSLLFVNALSQREKASLPHKDFAQFLLVTVSKLQHTTSLGKSRQD